MTATGPMSCPEVAAPRARCQSEVHSGSDQADLVTTVHHAACDPSPRPLCYSMSVRRYCGETRARRAEWSINTESDALDLTLVFLPSMRVVSRCAGTVCWRQVSANQILMAFAGQIIALTLWWRSLPRKTCGLPVFRQGMARYVNSVSHQTDTAPGASGLHHRFSVRALVGERCRIACAHQRPLRILDAIPPLDLRSSVNFGEASDLMRIIPVQGSKVEAS